MNLFLNFNYNIFFMKLKNTGLGFTLIELLVVITIIGILATGAVSVYTSQIQKARDTNRVTDIKALQSWVEQFYQDTSEYPQGGIDWLSGSLTDVQDYVPKFARDPKDHQSCNGSTECGYAYIVAADSNGILQWAYELSTWFENTWNTTNKAGTDWWDDNSRLELSIWSSVLSTVKDSSDSWGGTALDNTDTSASLHIGSVDATSTSPVITAF